VFNYDFSTELEVNPTPTVSDGGVCAVDQLAGVRNPTHGDGWASLGGALVIGTRVIGCVRGLKNNYSRDYLSGR